MIISSRSANCDKKAFFRSSSRSRASAWQLSLILGISFVFSLAGFAAPGKTSSSSFGSSSKALSPQQELSNWYDELKQNPNYKQAEYLKRLRTLGTPRYTKKTDGGIYSIKISSVEVEYPNLGKLQNVVEAYVAAGIIPLDKRIPPAIAVVLDKAQTGKAPTSELGTLTRLINVDNGLAVFNVFAEKSGKRFFEYIYSADSKLANSADSIGASLIKKLGKNPVDFKTRIENIRKGVDIGENARFIENALLTVAGKTLPKLKNITGKPGGPVIQLDQVSCQLVATINAAWYNDKARKIIQSMLQKKT
jgi:hypothetical protein